MAEQTADKVKFDKEEDIKPLLIAFRKIFEPITKSMQSIAKIPEEIKRIADNISKDIESGVPKRVAKGAGKLTASEADQALKDAFRALMSEDEIKSLERHEAMLKVLQDQNIPSKLDENNQAVKLTEKEIIESRKEFITEKKEQTKIEKQIEAASKEEGLDAEQQATKIQELQEKLEKSTEKTSQLETMLGSRTPQEIQQQERPGFVKPAFIEEMKSASNEAGIGQLSMVMEQLKGSFMGNIGTPLMSLINMTKKHNKVMEDYGETGEKVDKFSYLKYIAIAAGIALVIKGFAGFFGFDGTPKLTPAEKGEEARKKALEEGDDETTAMVKGNFAKRDAMPKFIDIPGLLFGDNYSVDPETKYGSKENAIDSTVRNINQNKYTESAGFQSLTGGSDFTKGGTTIVYQDVKQDNSQSNNYDSNGAGNLGGKPDSNLD
jgi:hypothetical protein